MSTTVKIKDDLQQISEYIAAIPAFIKHILQQSRCAPFQLDLLIVVKGVESVMCDENNDSDDDDDDDDNENDDEQQLDPNNDNIGDVLSKLRNLPVVCFFADINHNRNIKNAYEIITRRFGVKSFRKFADFRTELSLFNRKHQDDNDDYSISPRIKYDPNTYPQNRRFSILVDRRENKYDDDEHKDKIIFFQPP
eukprot:123306_1